MLGISGLQIIYAFIFLSILLIVEGCYMFLRGADQTQEIANRRMRAMASTDRASIAPSILREKVLGGPISQFVASFIPELKQAFWIANVSMTPGRAILMSSLAFAGLLTVMMIAAPLPFLISLVIAALVAFGLPLLILNIAVSKQRKLFDEQLPDAINLISRGLQAGHPVATAFGLVAKEMADPIGSEFGNAIDEINFGRDRTTALRDIAQRYPNPEFMFFVAAVEMQRESGGNLVGILDNLTKVIRERSHLKKKAIAVSAEGRLTAIIVGALPYVLGFFLFLTNPDLILGVWDHPLFFPIMSGAWVLWLVGIIVIWRMVNIKV